MHQVSNPMPQGIGGHHLVSHLSPRPQDLPSPRPPHGLPVDDIRISDRARLHMASRPSDVLPSVGAPGDGGLPGAVREVRQFLADHPRIANSPFGKAAALLIRGAVQLFKTEGTSALPDDGKARLLRAAERVEAFLAEHPRVAESPVGKAASALARGIASSIEATGDESGPGAMEALVRAAKQAESYLDEHPKLADMPLGRVVGRLVGGVEALVEGTTLDADLQTLAKRVGNFVQSHPRLAESEFGLIVSHLVRGITAYHATTPPVGESPAETDTPPVTTLTTVAVTAEAEEALRAA